MSREDRDELLTWKDRFIDRETDKSWGFKTGDEEEYAPGKYRDVLIFLPKSQCKIEPGGAQAGEIVDVHIPRWLVESKGLENEVEDYEG